MGSMAVRDPQALSSILASLGMLQPRAFRSLNIGEGDKASAFRNYVCYKEYYESTRIVQGWGGGQYQ